MKKNINNAPQLVSPFRFNVNFIVGPLIKRYCPNTNASILDVGCGKGYYRYFINEGIKGKYMGIDIASKNTWEKTKPQIGGLKINFQVLNAECLNRINDEFNFICAFQSFEHIRDDNKVLSEMRKKLKKNGYILITVPSRYSFFLYGIHGYRRYSPLSLKKLIKDNEFILEHITKIGGLGTFILHLFLWTIPSLNGNVHIWKIYGRFGLSKCIGWLECAGMKIDALFPVFECGYAVILKNNQ